MWGVSHRGTRGDIVPHHSESCLSCKGPVVLERNSASWAGLHSGLTAKEKYRLLSVSIWFSSPPVTGGHLGHLGPLLTVWDLTVTALLSHPLDVSVSKDRHRVTLLAVLSQGLSC